jgi:hypothetical protein
MRELRSVPLRGEFREEGGVLRFKGHAAVFDRLADLGSFRERVSRGAFATTIRSGGIDTAFLYNHEQDSVMARSGSGTLRLSEDRAGLLVHADLDRDDFDVQRIVPKMRRGDLDRMSFAFSVSNPQGGLWDDQPEDGGKPIRTLVEVRLYDVSVVTFPAYAETSAALV